MGTLDEVKNELKHKKKSVDDLIRFISTRNENEPNYSLLLGAGCSVSSGIRSATALISLWEKEIYELSTGEKFEEQKAADYFLTESWYDPKTRYSCLFEKRFDLPKQRRAFIEQEVDKKIPSIGYAYLVKLIEKAYFRTVFTTNFDDLLNQSFYSHSKERPIVCAHDSSINSVTVTSKRPKIIKLHGDYLFDDIKSSQRETESLEENMKSKFVEFTRDYGLIVVGFAGNDRSLMDVLNYLLRHDEYLGHGIYWCIRKGSEINSDLKRLLWHDRVFFVEVEGFDELFAEINAKIFQGKQLPYETRISSDMDDLLLEIKNNKKSFSNCKYILDDLKKSEDILMKEVIGNAVRSINEKGAENEYSDEENLILSKIRDQTIKEKYIEVVETVDPLLNRPKANSSADWLAELHTSKAYALKKLNKIDEAIVAYQDAIAFMQEAKVGNVLSTFARLIEINKNPEKKLEVIANALKTDPYWADAYYRKGQQLGYLYDSGFRKIEAREIVEAFNKSIELNPSATANKSFWAITDFILNERLYSDYKAEFHRAMDAVAKQDPYSTLTVEMNVAYLISEKKQLSEILSYIDGVKKANGLASREFDYDIAQLKAYERLATTDDIGTYLVEMDKKYPSNPVYLARKCELQLSKFRDIDAAIATAEIVLEKTKEPRAASKLAQLYLYNRQLTDTKELLSKYGKNPDFKDIAFQYHLALGNKEQAEKCMIKESELFDASDYSLYTCQLILLGEYQNARELLKNANENNNFGSNVLVINYELAKLRLSDHINIKRVVTVRDTSKHVLERAAASCLIYDEKKQSYEREARDKLIREALEENYERFYQMQSFPVFSSVDLKAFEKEKIKVYPDKTNLVVLPSDAKGKAA